MRDQLFFYVEGEVKLSGRLPYGGEMTVLRAITTAGGFTDFAQRKKIHLRRATGQKITVNWYDASKDPSKDPHVFPNDLISVPRRIL